MRYYHTIKSLSKVRSHKLLDQSWHNQLAYRILSVKRSLQMLRFLTVLVGIIFIISGVMGFIPEFVEDGRLFGYFADNNLRNVLHIVIGVIGLICGLKN